MVIFLNITVNYLLLAGTSRILGIRPENIRFLFAAIFGGLCAGISIIWDRSSINYSLERIITLVLINLIAYGIKKQSVRSGLVFLTLSMSLDGMTQMIPTTNKYFVIICAGAISCLCRFLRTGGTLGKQFAQIEIRYCKKVIKLQALRDTGNSLIDPVTGENMLVISPRIASMLTGLSQKELASPVNTLREGRAKGLWLVPYSTVGNKNGLMLAIRLPDVTMDGRKVKLIAALASEGLDEYDALIGG